MFTPTLTRSVILTTLIGLSACGSNMIVDDESTPVAPLTVDEEDSLDAITLTPEDEAELVDCGVADYEPTWATKPVDIIFVLDNSGSMGHAIKAVEKNINDNFAQIIEDSGFDYRVLMLSQHGLWADDDVCIQPPLADWSSDDVGCSGKPGNNEGKFYHYSRRIGSWNSLSRVLELFEFKKGQTLGGYHQWLRPQAFKVFIEITDDKVATTYPGGTLDDKTTAEGGELAAAQFDAALLELSPEHFGTAEARNYRWYSIAGMAGKNPEDPSQAWLPEDKIETAVCNFPATKTVTGYPYSPPAANPGTGYQALSRLTGGLRFPICNIDSYDVVFNHVAEGIIEQQAVPCEYVLPQVPEGKLLDLPSLSIEYTAGGDLTSMTFERVADERACTDGAFYVDGDVARLCAQSCTTVQADAEAAIELSFQCTEILK